MVTLEEQDHSRWDHAEIVEGIRLVETALALHGEGNYQLQGCDRRSSC